MKTEEEQTTDGTDITEYEPSRKENSRWLKSPLLSVIHLDERKLTNHSVQDAFSFSVTPEMVLC